MTGQVVAVSLNPNHGFNKFNQDSIKLIKGMGVLGDAHAGEKVKHPSIASRFKKQRV